MLNYLLKHKFFPKSDQEGDYVSCFVSHLEGGELQDLKSNHQNLSTVKTVDCW